MEAADTDIGNAHLRIRPATLPALDFVWISYHLNLFLSSEVDHVNSLGVGVSDRLYDHIALRVSVNYVV